METEGGRGPISSPARWTQTPVALPIIAGRQETALSRVGCFQKISVEHSDGRTFIINAEESAAAPGTVLRLAVYESVSADKTFTGGVDYTFRADTTIANGWVDDEIVGLREWSADLRLDAIFISFIQDEGGGKWTLNIIKYDIDAFTFTGKVEVDADNKWLSCDIAVTESGPLRDDNTRNIGHGSMWMGALDTADVDPAIAQQFFPKFYQILYGNLAEPTNYSAEGWGRTTVYTNVGTFRSLQSMFDGGKSIYSINDDSGAASTNNFWIRIWQELLNRLTPTTVNVFFETQISGTIDNGSVLYDFGTWDACYIDRYNYQVQAKWIRNTGNTGWNLYIGRRNQNGVFTANLIKQVEYSGLGVTNIETELENVGTFPEVVISTDENGKVYVIFAFPDPAANAFGGSGIGFLDGDPFTTIEMISFDGDEIYDPQNLDIRTVWIGADEPSIQSLKHISAPHRTDSQGLDISDVVLWFSMRDNVNDLRYVFYRN